MEIKFGFNEPKKNVKTTGLHPGIFNDDFKFTFEAPDVHTSDPKELEAMFRDLDLAVAKFKEALTKKWP